MRKAGKAMTRMAKIHAAKRMKMERWPIIQIAKTLEIFRDVVCKHLEEEGDESSRSALIAARSP